ncbi:hypothetical protein [Herbaspirillum rubrisubalbicans]|uniref:hypothetical protein n=1 Tax=Herbaspirillum rubrisubalbicans TaxID=80842 RepID=UPI000DD3383F|nr:hypothetical protein [Herbaspirillum rubrisubalbicans]
MSTTIEDRAILLLKGEAELRESQEDPNTPVRGRKIGGHGFWERLGEQTGIASKRWRQVYGRQQRVTSDMLEALAKWKPKYAFWLATGITDATNGHVAPETVQTFPERDLPDSDETNEYFEYQLQMQTALADNSKIKLMDDKTRLYAYERTRPIGIRLSSPIAQLAYEISKSAAYEELQQRWEEREADRAGRLERIKEVKDSANHDVHRPHHVEQKDTVVSFDLADIADHQDMWELFYRSTSTERTVFAWDILNKPVQQLSDEEIKSIAEMQYPLVMDYLATLEIDPSTVLDQDFIPDRDRRLHESERHLVISALQEAKGKVQ